MIITNVYPFNGGALTEQVSLRITGRKIAEIASFIVPEANEEVVDGKGMIAVPGMVDAHRHVWQSGFKSVAGDMMLLTYLDQVVGQLGSRLTADDLYTLNLYGYMEAAAAGVTTMFDWSHAMNSAEHADAALQAALDSRMKVLFFHATPASNREQWWNNSQRNHKRDIIRLAEQYGQRSPDLKMGMGIRGPEFAVPEVNRHDLELARDLNIPASMHVGCSILGKIHKPILQLADQGLLHAGLNLVHCNTLSAAEFQLIQDAGCHISVTPEAELQMGLGLPVTDAVLDLEGLKWSVGVDIVTAASNSLFFQKRLYLQYLRGAANQRLIDDMQLPVDMPLLSQQLFCKSISNASHFAGFDDCSVIAVGKDADITLMALNDLETGTFRSAPSFCYFNEKDIDSVLVSGSFVIRNGAWCNADKEALKSKVHAITQRVVN